MQVRDELRADRLNEYKAHEGQADEDVLTEDSEETLPTEEVGPIKVEGETQARYDRPNNNEDAILMNHEKGLFGVFDGVGGHLGGEQSSREAANIIEGLVGSKFSSAKEVQWSLTKALERADRELSSREVGYTTATVAKIWEQEGSKVLVFAHKGDSRLFLLREGESIEQLTLDDGHIKDALEDGQITREQAETIDQATSEEQIADPLMRKLFKVRNQVEPLGTGRAVFSVGAVHLKPGDIFVITSDGIHDNLPKNHIENIVLNTQNPARALVDGAYEYSREGHFRSKRDDMSAIVIKVPSTEGRFADFPEFGN